MDRYSSRLGRGFLALLFVAASAEAQLLTIPRFDFSFSNPGARSLGFGGAFAALADDATAAYANPAGLVQLVEPEVSVETRLWSRSPSFIAGGRLDGEPTGQGIDTLRGFAFDRDHSEDFGPSFASVVIPKGRWSFALYGHQLANFEESAESQGFFSDEYRSSPFGLFRSPGLRETVDLEVVTTGAAVGWRMIDQLSFGLGIVYSDVSMRTSADNYGWDYATVESRYGRIAFLPQDRVWSTDLSIEGHDVTANAGVLWRIYEQLSASVFYRQGAEVEGSSVWSSPFFNPFELKARFKVPDVAGGGLAFRSKDGRVTLATEADLVEYAGLLWADKSAGRKYEDAWEYHFGAEYALLQSTPILAFRVGAWFEAHRDELGDRNLTHLSAGLGIVARALQIDLAGDFSDNGDTASLSVIYTF